MASSFFRRLRDTRKLFGNDRSSLSNLHWPNRRSGGRNVLRFETLESRHLLNGDGLGVLANPQVSIPNDLQGVPGYVVVAPVNIDDADGVRAAEIHIQYDTVLLDADNDGVRSGSVWPKTNTFLDPYVDDAAGTIVVWVYGIEALGPGGGSLVEINFTVADDVCEGQADPTVGTQLILDQVILSGVSEGDIPAETSDGSITIQCNDPPTDIELDNTSVQENKAISTLVGTFTTTDPDAGDSHIYGLVSGDGDADNSQFVIDGETLKTTAIFDYETKNTYSIRVRTTDSDGDWYEKPFAITVTDVNEPPQAQPDEFATDIDTELTVESPGLLANDFDEDVGDAIKVVTVDISETLGTVVDWNENGGFRYEPPEDYEGEDHFHYTVEDLHGATSEATATIRVGRNATVSGFVYADTDCDGRPGEHEGVPGVLITLTVEGVSLETEGVSSETWTDDHGWYEFRELLAGTYKIVERQPECMIDGGDNTLSDVTVEAAQSTVGQNFRELGLKPEYVFNRFYTTSTMAIGSKPWRDVCKRVVKDGEEDIGRSPSSPPAVTQQILQQGSEVVVRGTNGDDDFKFVAADTGDGQHEVTLNGETHHFDASVVSSILFDGGLGIDTATMIGSAAVDQLEASPKTASLRGAGYVAEVTGTEKTTVSSGMGAAQDKAILFDSFADDTLEAEIDFARLSAYYFENVLREFEEITAFSQRGGQDTKAVAKVIDYLLTTEGPWAKLHKPPRTAR